MLPMAKQLSDGRIDFNDDLSSEELELMQGWYSGQGDPLYALQSSGTLNREDLQRAINNLSSSFEHMTNEEVTTAECLIATIEAAQNQFPITDEED
jgi:hypothetical protein